MKMIKHHRLILLLLLIMVLSTSPGTTDPPSIAEAFEAYLLAFPDVKNIGVIYSKAENEATIGELEDIAKSKNVGVIKFRSPTIKEFPKATRDLKDKVDTIWVIDDPIYSIHEAWSYFVFFTMRNRIKTVVSTEQALKECGLFYYTAEKEIVVNKKILGVLGLSVSSDAGPITYYEPGA